MNTVVILINALVREVERQQQENAGQLSMLKGWAKRSRTAYLMSEIRLAHLQYEYRKIRALAWTTLNPFQIADIELELWIPQQETIPSFYQAYYA